MNPLVDKSSVINALVEVGDRAVCDMVVDAALVRGDNGVAWHRIFKGLDGYNATAKVNDFLAGPGAGLSQPVKDQLTAAATAWDATGAAAVAHQMRVGVELAAAELGLAL